MRTSRRIGSSTIDEVKGLLDQQHSVRPGQSTWPPKGTLVAGLDKLPPRCLFSSGSALLPSNRRCPVGVAAAREFAKVLAQAGELAHLIRSAEQLLPVFDGRAFDPRRRTVLRRLLGKVHRVGQ